MTRIEKGLLRLVNEELGRRMAKERRELEAERESLQEKARGQAALVKSCQAKAVRVDEMSRRVDALTYALTWRVAALAEEVERRDAKLAGIADARDPLPLVLERARKMK